MISQFSPGSKSVPDSIVAIALSKGPKILQKNEHIRVELQKNKGYQNDFEMVLSYLGVPWSRIFKRENPLEKMEVHEGSKFLKKLDVESVETLRGDYLEITEFQ